MSPEVWTPVINTLAITVASILITVIGLGGKLIHGKLKKLEAVAIKAAVNSDTAAKQLQNDHVADPNLTSNLRENIDENHAETKQILNEIKNQVNGLGDSLRNTDRNVANVLDATSDHARRLAELESTKPAAEVRKIARRATAPRKPRTPKADG